MVKYKDGRQILSRSTKCKRNVKIKYRMITLYYNSYKSHKQPVDICRNYFTDNFRKRVNNNTINIRIMTEHS